MPDSNDYREAAVQFNRSAGDVWAVNGPVAAAFGPEVLVGGSLADSLGAEAEEHELVMAAATTGVGTV